ncbi:pyrimidine-nucleoside phosphorylase Pdp [Thermoclostridium stercorarium subsp. stercorarium DSM 8532]|uniref:Pyrimidine-nucleoside phosphorylase n=2 Tax=Thermoclostridium stercorarium TaxID=1510 RepID=L7VRC3_THES1|nr:pyrimidine-nucleoside phosphorylase [Thermoclostridium stercorarium]AGC69327.1 pyrimidine-nucleoside phosphorylase Pdp [Thermoclostridium stercorarium subsp. stercorarium DSM 8532]AGI40292.1 thymidine phosphorylase [Thermoclostridium stercorarium subsp. stercorarium DSM 8532]ANW99589.1 pyrimidine-nucleoside phosphorylase [Thermoclostridium stercorarium subsp. thermolacticum DSM 2910]
MFALDLIIKKRNGQKLTKGEIEYFVNGYTKGEIPDYQASAFLMAVYFNGMDTDETLWLTEAMLNSGDRVDLSAIPGVKVDKHSTGGVGDKTTLVVAPIVASYGVPVAKMSGRGLGHTGGTVDKLESIPGFRTNLSREEFIRNVREIGIAVAGQTENLVPADKKLYALRDVTGTVENISLIAASIMSKKLALGSDAIVLDVKTGSGAFMKTVAEAERLARLMVDIGNGAGRRTVALITDMDRPLGNNIGNALEVKEAVETLNGKGPEDLKEVCIELAANMLFVAGKGEIELCRNLAAEAIEKRTALNKLIEMVIRQGGDPKVIEDTSKLPRAEFRAEWKAEKSGFVEKMNAERLGIASVLLGAGRKTKEEAIDPAAGIELVKKTRDKVEKGETIAFLYASDENRIHEALQVLKSSIVIGPEPVPEKPMILGRIQ